MELYKKYKVLKEFVLRDGDVAKVDTTVAASVGDPEEYIKGLVDNGYMEEIRKDRNGYPPYYSEYLYLDDKGIVKKDRWCGYPIDRYRWAIGNSFKTGEEVEKAGEWLKAFKVLRDDSRGYHPKKNDGVFFAVRLDIYDHSLGVSTLSTHVALAYVHSPIIFESETDAKKSIKEHEKEWRIFLGVEE